MPLSSGSIVHFTPDRESLFGILKDRFRIFYCTERYIFANGFVEMKVPIVSFCDIPMSELKDHIGKYGSYGIGLNKEWAVSKGLNPVMYIEANSKVAASLEVILRRLTEIDIEKPMDEVEFATLDMYRYVKNYQGRLVRSTGEVTENYRFSDEREWRFAPLREHCQDMFLTINEYNEFQACYDEELGELRLDFEPSDVKYIIIKDESEISDTLEHIKRNFRAFPYDDVNRLLTRVITASQIRSDF